MLNQNPKAIIFDLDDTLIPSSKFYDESVRAVLPNSSERISLFYEARQQVKLSLPHGHTSSRNRLLYFKRYLEICGNRNTSAVALYDRYENELCRRIRDWSKEHQRFSILEKLREKYPLYILTNENTRTQLQKINALSDGKVVVDGVVTSEEVGFEKPDKRMFFSLFERFSLSPGDCLYIGDCLTNDIAPAQEIGLPVFQTLEFQPDNERPDDRVGHPRIHHLSDLAGIFL